MRQENFKSAENLPSVPFPHAFNFFSQILDIETAKPALSKKPCHLFGPEHKVAVVQFRHLAGGRFLGGAAHQTSPSVYRNETR